MDIIGRASSRQDMILNNSYFQIDLKLKFDGVYSWLKEHVCLMTCVCMSS